MSATPGRIFDIEQTAIAYPNIFKGVMFNNDERVKYGLAFRPTESVRDSLIREGLWSKEGLFNTRTNYPPIIHADDYEILVKAFAIADARNIMRDRLFIGVIADLTVQTHEFNTKGNEGVTLLLQKITVKAQDILDVAKLS